MYSRAHFSVTWHSVSHRQLIFLVIHHNTTQYHPYFNLLIRLNVVVPQWQLSSIVDFLTHTHNLDFGILSSLYLCFLSHTQKSSRDRCLHDFFFRIISLVVQVLVAPLFVSWIASNYRYRPLQLVHNRFFYMTIH